MNRQFPAFRGLAIVFVLINHAIVMSIVIPQRFGHAAPGRVAQAFLSTIKEVGLFAVPIFLFMSGAFLVFAIQNRPVLPSFKIIMATLLHTLTPYVLWSLVFYTMVLFIFGERYSALQYIKNLIIGYPFNFVPLLIFFYLISPFLIRVSRKLPVVLLLLIFVFQLILLNIEFPGTLGFSFPEGAERINPPIISDTLASWGIFFPLGITFSLYRKSILPVLIQIRWVLVTLTAALFGLTILNELAIVTFPIADLLAPLVGMCLMPLIPRERIPLARWLESMGKRSYGLYLTNLIILTLGIYGIEQLIPQALDYHLVSAPFLFLFALSTAQLIMKSMERSPTQSGYRYIFG